MLSYINTNAKQNNRIESLGTFSHSLTNAPNGTRPRFVFFSNDPKSGLYLGGKVGPYEVCIFVNIGPFEKRLH